MRISKELYILAIFLFYSVHVQADIDMRALPGFDGYHKHGRWLPLRITLASMDADVTGEVIAEIRDGTAGGKQIYSVPINLFRATRKAQYLYVLPESFQRDLQLKLVDSYGKEVLKKDVRLVTVPLEDLFMVVVSPNAGGLEFLTATSEQVTNFKIHVSYITADLLPDKWKGYDSADVMLLGEISAGALSPDQWEAITDWVYGGGRLIVSGGVYSQNLVGTSIEQLLPVKINGTRVLDSISLPQQLSRGIDRERIVLASSELTDDGKAVAMEDDGLPIIAERKVGDGEVIFLAFDYLDPAFRAWDGKREIWETLLPQSTTRRNPRDADIDRLLSASRSARMPSYKLVGFFLLSYILCFGPLSYFILRRSNRSGWAWVAMSLIAVVFTTGSLGFTYATRSQAAVVSDFSVMDIYQDVKRARLSSYFSLFSPAKTNYIIEFPEPEAMFVNPISSPDSRIRQGSDCKLIERDVFQMQVLGMKTLSLQLFYGESYVDFGGNVSINLSESHEGFVYGEVISNLPFDLTDCYVFSNGRYTYIGDLKARAQVELGQDRSGDVPGIYSMKDAEKQRFINAIRLNLSHRVSGTGLMGWMEVSALEKVVRMEMGEFYRSQGLTLVIAHI